MDEYVLPRTFERLVAENIGDWPAGDRRMLREAKALLAGSRDRPWFLVVFLMSTHFRYVYPPEYANRGSPARPAALAGGRLRTTWFGRQVDMFGDYRSSLAFMDDLLGDFLEGLDPERHLIAITGDHGEAFYEDGTAAHGTLLSDAQTRVPLLIRGPGIPVGVLSGPTTHADLTPTLLHAIAGRSVRELSTHGRDLLAEAALTHTLLANPDETPARAVLVRGNQRLELRIGLDRPVLYASGFVDAHHRPDWRAIPRIEEAPAWATAVIKEIERVAR
jgi:membrane-anchored protein YejM (alkaline phosphatase superfamily)